MTRKFLFCFPLRLGSIVFGYIVIIISFAVVLTRLQQLLVELLMDDDQKIRTESGIFTRMENIFGADKKDLIAFLMIIYYLSYIVIGLLLLVFGIIYLCGVYNMSQCSVSTFFIYCFLHLFFTLGLIIWEGFSAGWIEVVLIVVSDLLLMVCLSSVKYLVEAMRNGHIYTQPEEVLYKY